MEGLESDSIGGFNAMLKEQRALNGEVIVTTVLFDDKYELLHDRIDIKAVAPLTAEDYTVRGSTALLDALGKTMHKIREAQKNTAEDFCTEKVMFVIITDGFENVSREYSVEHIKKRVEHQREKYGWEFAFFGANMDAIMEAGNLASPQTVRVTTSPTIQEPAERGLGCPLLPRLSGKGSSLLLICAI